jgi:hypothetical protein
VGSVGSGSLAGKLTNGSYQERRKPVNEHGEKLECEV